MSFSTLLVTGANGLLGSNVCQQAVNQGRRVRGLVRREADAAVLRQAGIEPVIGDITEPDSLTPACAGVDGVIHAAARIGGTWSTATRADFEQVNYQGTINVLDAARAAGVKHVLLVGSLAMVDTSRTVTEDSPLAAIHRDGSPYLITKLAAYYAAMHRACLGENISYVLPGAMYGPSLFVGRALEPTLYTGTLQRAIVGELTRYVRYLTSWPYVADAAAITLAALDRAVVGARYLAGGRDEDKMSLAEFCNLGCELAGVDHRVRDLSLDEVDFDLGTMRAYVERPKPSPLIDPSRTTAELDVRYTSVPEGVEATVAWLRDHGRI